MKTCTITRNNLDKNNNYIGETDLTDFDGDIVALRDLGTVFFKSLKAKGGIYFGSGSGISADLEIKAGE